MVHHTCDALNFGAYFATVFTLQHNSERNNVCTFHHYDPSCSPVYNHFSQQSFQFVIYFDFLLSVFVTIILQSQPKVVGTLELDHIFPISFNQCWKISRFFSSKKGKNQPIINIVSVGRGELASCPNFFVRDCSYSWRTCLHQFVCLSRTCSHSKTLGKRSAYIANCKRYSNWTLSPQCE